MKCLYIVTENNTIIPIGTELERYGCSYQLKIEDNIEKYLIDVDKQLSNSKR